VDDPTIADVHGRFLDDPTATDVITFPHGDGLGEIIVSYDTALRQADQFGEPWLRELFRYMIHGLLHLHGYLDGLPEQRELMFSYQEPLVAKYAQSLPI
jgi:probable rRNA maturation factor